LELQKGSERWYLKKKETVLRTAVIEGVEGKKNLKKYLRTNNAIHIIGTVEDQPMCV
jgi:hypothetical protein